MVVILEPQVYVCVCVCGQQRELCEKGGGLVENWCYESVLIWFGQMEIMEENWSVKRI